MRSINDIAQDIHFTSVAKGFEVPNAENINQKLLLAVSEICEAQEELRDGHGLNEIYYKHTSEDLHGMVKPEGFPIELADAIIRLLHIGHALGIDLEHVIELKLAYNKTRPDKHGRKF